LGRRLAVLGVLLRAFGIIIPQVAAARSFDENAVGGTAAHVHVTASRPGHGDTILITLRIDPGYHVNANPASEDYLIPTSVAFTGAEPQRLRYPPSVRFKPAFSGAPIDVYEGTVVIAASFPPGILDRTSVRSVAVTAQACTYRICLPPADIPAKVE
jgi:hypothetical protein